MVLHCRVYGSIAVRFGLLWVWQGEMNLRFMMDASAEKRQYCYYFEL
jgi:hypothetical protein